MVRIPRQVSGCGLSDEENQVNKEQRVRPESDGETVTIQKHTHLKSWIERLA